MSTIFNKLKAQKPAEETIAVGGETVLVRGLKRSKRQELLLECMAPNGKADNERFEAELAAACCLDPKSQQPIQVDWREWDLESYIFEPLIKAVGRVNGLDNDNEAAAKKSDT